MADSINALIGSIILFYLLVHCFIFLSSITHNFISVAAHDLHLAKTDNVLDNIQGRQAEQIEFCSELCCRYHQSSYHLTESIFKSESITNTFS